MCATRPPPSLLEYDQLSRAMAHSEAFNGLVEGRITFPPTYKFDKGTMAYDTSKKTRVPSYTDRILFKPNGVNCNDYGCIKGNEGKEDWEDLDVASDHKAVYAQFSVR